jgi:hypothetical protein
MTAPGIAICSVFQKNSLNGRPATLSFSTVE